MDGYQKEERQSFRVCAFAFDSLFVSAIPTLIAMALSVPLGRPLNEGLLSGFVLGVALLIASLTTTRVRQHWFADTERLYTEAKLQRDKEWKDEHSRPSDEPLGWCVHLRRLGCIDSGLGSIGMGTPVWLMLLLCLCVPAY